MPGFRSREEYEKWKAEKIIKPIETVTHSMTDEKGETNTAAELWQTAYSFQYTQGNINKALELYNHLINTYPSSLEALYAKDQISLLNGECLPQSQQLEMPRPEKLSCSKCGATSIDAAAFCHACGNNLKENSSIESRIQTRTQQEYEELREKRLEETKKRVIQNKEARLLWQKAYDLHHKESNLQKATDVYNQIINQCPNTPEAGYAQTQLQNIKSQQMKDKQGVAQTSNLTLLEDLYAKNEISLLNGECLPQSQKLEPPRPEKLFCSKCGVAIIDEAAAFCHACGMAYQEDKVNLCKKEKGDIREMEQPSQISQSTPTEAFTLLRIVYDLNLSKQEHIEKALDLCKQIIDQFPNSSAAQKAKTKIIEINKKKVENFVGGANKLYKEGDVSGAIKLLTKIVEQFPDTNEAKSALLRIDKLAAANIARQLWQKASILQAKGKNSESMEICKKIIGECPESQEATEAKYIIKIFEQEQQKQKENMARDLYAKASNLYAAGNLSEALTLFQQILQEFHNYPEALNAKFQIESIQNEEKLSLIERASSHFFKGNFPSAIKLYEEIVKDSEYTPEAEKAKLELKNIKAIESLWGKASNYHAEGKSTEAIGCYCQIIEEAPNSPLSVKAQSKIDEIQQEEIKNLWEKATLYSFHGRKQEAIELYEQIIRRFPFSISARNAKSQLTQMKQQVKAPEGLLQCSFCRGYIKPHVAYCKHCGIRQDR